MRTAPDPHFILSDLGAPGQRCIGRRDCDIKFLRLPFSTCWLKFKKLRFMTYFVEIKTLKPWCLKVEVFMRASESLRHLGWFTVASLIHDPYHIILKKNAQPRLNLAILKNIMQQQFSCIWLEIAIWTGHSGLKSFTSPFAMHSLRVVYSTSKVSRSVWRAVTDLIIVWVGDES